MKDFDIIDRKSTTVSPVQTVLALLALLPLIAIAAHQNPAIGYWHRGQFRDAIVTAILYPGMYAVLLGLAFPIVSTLRGEMSRRGLLIALAVFGALAIILNLLVYASLPTLLAIHPSHPGSTRWVNYVQSISFHATFNGYATGFSVGCMLSLLMRRPAVVSPAVD
ncbi:MAG: hypothetical protein ACYDBB_07480 [Armatimonadota bacterium]